MESGEWESRWSREVEVLHGTCVGFLGEREGVDLSFSPVGSLGRGQGTEMWLSLPRRDVNFLLTLSWVSILLLARINPN